MNQLTRIPITCRDPLQKGKRRGDVFIEGVCTWKWKEREGCGVGGGGGGGCVHGVGEEKVMDNFACYFVWVGQERKARV